jgi:hypothetical protein
MVSISRAIVVLRGELGNQQSLAVQEFKDLQDKEDYKRKETDLKIAFKRIERIESATEALGRLTLGDIIEEKELF